MIVKKCPVCGKIFQLNGKNRCTDCDNAAARKDADKVYNQRYRNKEADRFYHSAAWKRLSKAVLLKAHYRCAICGGLAVEVHHVVEVKDDWDKRLDITNLMPLCTSCHNRQR